MASEGWKDEVPVFTETSMGTHIAIAVSPHITARDFKGELERAHFNCFQRLGEIRVYCLMVKRKSCFYHLPDSVPIKHAFQGLKGTWFFHAEASPLSPSDRPGLPECVGAEVGNQISNGRRVTDSLEAKNYMKTTCKQKLKRKGKKRRIKRSHCLKAVLRGLLATVYLSKKKKRNRKRVKKNYFIGHTANGIEKICLSGNEEYPGVTTLKNSAFFASGNEVQPIECNSVPVVETASQMSSEVISVTGIIKRYFSDFNEVSRHGSPSSSDVTSRLIHNQLEEQLKAKTDDNCSNIQAGAMPDFKAKTPPRMLPFLLPRDLSYGRSSNKFERTEIGKRLVTASNNLRTSASKQRPAISVCRFKDGKLFGSNSSSLVRSLVFEISDSDD